MFENKYIEEWDCYYSRVIESWHKACRRNKIHWSTTIRFRRWLNQLNYRNYKLSKNQISEIMAIFENGKMELEVLATNFIRKELEETQD